MSGDKEEEENINEYKLVVVGDIRVGKTALTYQFIEERFREDVASTQCDSFRKQFIIDNEKCNLDILDTVGLDEVAAMSDIYNRSGHGFIIVYSITCHSSFELAALKREQIINAQERDNVPIVIVGNKCDLEADRKVTTSEGYDLAQSFHCPFFETSAKHSVNIHEPLFQLVREVRIDNQRRLNAVHQIPRNKRCIIC